MTHALPTIKTTPPSSIPPHLHWLLIESVDGYRAAVRTSIEPERLRDKLELADVHVVHGGHELRDQATKLFERPRPKKRDL